jgi:signal transduction histidine kinase/Tfp pilus assembly protein PilF
VKSALEIMRKTGDKNGIASLHQSLGWIYTSQQKNDSAQQHFLIAKSIYQETNNKKELGYLLTLIGISQRYMGNYGDAIETQIQALNVGREIRDALTIKEALLALAFTFARVEKWEEAIDYQKQALELLTLWGDSSGVARVYSDLGVTYMSMDSLDAAIDNHFKALAIRKNLMEVISISSTYFYIGSIYLEKESFQKALENFSESLKYSLMSDYTNLIVDSQLELGRVYTLMDNDELALKNYREALVFSKEKQDWYGTFQACEAIADVHLANGDTKLAIDWLNRAVNAAPNNAYSRINGVYKKLSDAYVLIGDYKKGYKNNILYSQTKDSILLYENSEKIAILTNRLDYENRQALQNESHKKIVQLKQAEINRQRVVKNFSLFGMAVIFVMTVVIFIRFREKKKLNSKLQHTLTDLKSTQGQLIQSEKMASLGELTAGIAHEIQNPLNFVNNFSEVSNELIDEMNEEIAKGDLQEAKIIAADVKQNLAKIHHHGKRAEAIVKGMLQHSRSSSGKKEPMDINKLADEYLRLAYHGLRAKDKSFNVKIESDFDTKIDTINIVPQDIGRVILNLITNAFYAATEKQKSGIEGFEPTVSVSTKKQGDKIELEVKDNGNGIPQDVLAKIFQPFFTTKPAGQGTGLGLSLSYDIIKAHGGELKVETTSGKGTTFIIQLNKQSV